MSKRLFVLLVNLQILVFFLLLFYNCVDLRRYPYPKGVLSSLEKAGENKMELIKVLDHYKKYPQDSLKYRAACFLISNMKGHFSSKRIESYPDLVKESFKKIDSLTKVIFFHEADTSLFRFADYLHNILDTKDFAPTKGFVDSLIKRTYPDTVDVKFHRKKVVHFEHFVDSIGKELLFNIQTENQTNGIYPDLKNISCNWLIDHIDNAFSCWKKSPFARDLSYNEFNNTLLTYRSMNESVDTYSSYINNYFYGIVHSNDSLNLANTVRRLNFATYCLDVFEDNGHKIGNLGFYDILQFYKFDCDRHSEWTVRVLNACGVPAYLDYTSGYFNRDKIHYGVSVRDTSGIYHHYSPKWQQLGDYRHQNELSKMYRNMYVKQRCPRTLASINEYVPNTFKNPYMKDVTEEYHKVTTFSVPYKFKKDSTNRKLGYLAIFSPRGWKPIAWGEIDYDRKKINFEKVPVNATYIVGIYDSNGFIPISNPLHIDFDRKVMEIAPNNNPITLRLTRKFPLKYHLIEFMKDMIGSKIQGANSADFSDAIDLYSIGSSDILDFSVKALPISTKKKFRYVRCISNGKPLNIATFEVFSSVNQNMNIVKGSEPSILSEEKLRNVDVGLYTKLNGNLLPSSQDVERALDGNLETYVTTFSIGIDFGSPQHISQVRFAPRNANNGIVIGDNYELLYYDKRWKSGGSKIAEYNFLKFENVPENTIYWLRNKDHGKEELPFVYRDGKQIFVNER